jgi:hypothetical protein
MDSSDRAPFHIMDVSWVGLVVAALLAIWGFSQLQ